MTNAFVETTILVDVLLKEGQRRKNAETALLAFDRTLLPVYAIKELKAGALRNFIWVHNKLVETGSYQETLAAIQRVSMSPRRYLPATAVEALATIGQQYRKLSPADFVEKYGSDATMDSCLYDHARLVLKRRIFAAWRKRRKVTDEVVCDLPCYREVDLTTDTSGQISTDPVACDNGSSCCLAVAFAKKPEVKALEKAIPTEAARGEDKRRREALKLLRLGREVRDRECRDLGDAVFALQCPADAVILTTNDRDHRPLAAALNKTVTTPSEVLANQATRRT
jgi:hypothetical protein